MTIKETIIKIIDIIFDERAMYKDDEVLSLPIIRFKKENIYVDDFCRIMEKLTYEGCLYSEEDYDICNFDPTYIYSMNYAKVKPNYKRLAEYKKQISKNNKKIKLSDFTVGKHKIYISEKFFTDIKSAKKDIILIYFAERYGKLSRSILIEDFYVWCKKRYPEIYSKAERHSQGITKWFRNGVDDINDHFFKQRGKKQLVILNKANNTYDITEPITIK